MEKNIKFKKVLNIWDVLVVAFGAMIGWGWVVSSGGWIQSGGVLGTIIGFIIGGLMIFFVGLTYAELTPAMPKTGGEHLFSFKAFGPTGSFICTCEFATAVVSVRGIAFGVLIRKHASDRRQYVLGNEILARDKFDIVLLSDEFFFDPFAKFRIRVF